MARLIDKDALVAEIERRTDELYDLLPDASKVENGSITTSEACNTGKYTALESFKDYVDTLEVKEVDLELITGWFDHIAQIADDRMTLTNQRMTDTHALDEIKCLAKNSSEFITKHYKAQKGE